MHHGLGNLAEGGHQAMDQQEDEQEAHGGGRCYVRPGPEARSVAGRIAPAPGGQYLSQVGGRNSPGVTVLWKRT
jgi:hypothetical protein